jgi:hypothetical protein
MEKPQFAIPALGKPAAATVDHGSALVGSVRHRGWPRLAWANVSSSDRAGFGACALRRPESTVNAESSDRMCHNEGTRLVK